LQVDPARSLEKKPSKEDCFKPICRGEIPHRGICTSNLGATASRASWEIKETQFLESVLVVAMAMGRLKYHHNPPDISQHKYSKQANRQALSSTGLSVSYAPIFDSSLKFFFDPFHKTQSLIS